MREMYNVAMELYTNHTLVYYYIMGIGAIGGIIIRESVPGIVAELKTLISRYGVRRPK